MSLLVCWVAFPAALAALAVGCGLALERVARTVVPGCLLMPAGLAVLVVVSHLATATDTTAELATPAVVAVAAAGAAASLRTRVGRRLDGWTVAAAVGVFAALAAPVVLSGEATFAGFVKLDDTSSWVAISEHLVHGGRNLGGLAPSGHEATLQVYLANGYPVGAFLPLAVGAQVVGEDPLWLFQPWLAFLAAALALSINGLLTGVVGDRRLRALFTFVAAQPALLFGYAMWGGAKELATAWVVAVTVALVPITLRATGVRGLLPFAVAIAATVAIASPPGAIWIVPAVAFVLAGFVRRGGRRLAVRRAAGLGALELALAAPSLALAYTFLTGFVGGDRFFRPESDRGALSGPLNPLQVFGIWPAGDFRLAAPSPGITYLLINVVILSAIAGAVALAARRAWPLALYACGTLAIGLVVAAWAGPWLAGKSLAIAAPAALTLACAGVAALWHRRRPEAIGLAAAITGGVLWSNAMAYSNVSLAPRQQLAELERIGHLFAGQGPLLLTEYNEYGSRHLLRDAQAEGLAEELRRVAVVRRDGRLVESGKPVDMDALLVRSVLAFRTLVVRRSPIASRPPQAYRLAWRGATYDVWQRSDRVDYPVADLPLGAKLSPAAEPRCSEVRRLAVLAGPRGSLAAVPRPAPVTLNLGELRRPAGWGTPRSDRARVVPVGDGAVVGTVFVPRSGRFALWVGGSSRGRLTLMIDGERIGAATGVVNKRGAYIRMGTATLRAGSHRVRLAYDAGGLRPGSDAAATTPTPVGPLVFEPVPQTMAVIRVPAADWRTLCGRTLDWIQALRGA